MKFTLSRNPAPRSLMAALLLTLLCGVTPAFAGEVPVAQCGNEVVEPGEQCDDGGTQDGDCCSAQCQFEAQGSPCPDENWCNGTETCNGSGQCQAGTAPDCDDGEVCTNDICNSLQQVCMHLPNRNACDDGDPCTIGDSCSEGQCSAGGGQLDCNDNNECTNDSCTQFVGCGHTANSGPCDDNNACTTNSSCSDGQCVGGTPITCNDNSSCTTDTCDPLSGCVFNPTVESQACGTCEDGTDNDADDNIDAEDTGCATLALLQRFAVISSKDNGNNNLYSGSDVLVDSVGGNMNVPYPLGQSRAGMCGHVMAVRAGTNAGILALDTKIKFGQGTTIDRNIDAREEFVSDAIQIKLQTKAPLVGPGACSNNAMQSCVADSDCGMGTCDGRLRLDANPANPFVDMTGNADNFQRCQAALAALTAINDEVAQLPAVGVGTLLGTPGTDDVKTNANTTLVQMNLGGGLQVIHVRDLKLAGNTEFRINGQPDTVLVVRLSRKFRLGTAAKVTLQGGLTADQVLWNVEGSSGGHPDFVGDSYFAGTVLAPRRSVIRTGTAVVVDGALFSKKVHLGAETTITHLPFTPLVP